MGDVTTQRWPWEPIPVAETVALLQADVAFIVAHTAIAVHSSRPELRMFVNVRRGQIVPRNECTFSDGSTVEFQDIGAPQPGLELWTVTDLVRHVWQTAANLGLSL